MEEAVALARLHTAPGAVCLFSPAAASYNRYKSFEEKGAHFKRCADAQ
jgi:UDP-N-acetylmuramoylalanine--D-glutamate ligase